MRLKIRRPDPLRVSQLVSVAAGLACLFVVALYLRLYNAFLWGYFLNEFDPYIRYYTTKLVHDLGLAAGLSWWLSGGLAEHVAEPIRSAYSIQAVDGVTRFTQFWHPLGVNWAKVLSPGVSVSAVLFYEIVYKHFDQSFLRSVIVFPAVINSAVVLAAFYLCWRISDRRFRLWCGLVAALWCTYSLMIIQRGLAGWFDDVAIFQFLAVLGLALFVESVMRSGVVRALFLVGSLLVNGFTVWVWGSFFYLWNLYGLFATIIALYIVYKLVFRRQIVALDVGRILTAYLAVYVGFAVFILITPRYGVSTFTSGLGILAHVGLITIVASYLMTRASPVKLITYSSAIKTVIVVAALVLMVVFSLAQMGVVKAPIKISGKFLEVLTPWARSPIVASVGEHQVTDLSSTFVNLGLTVPLAAVLIAYTIVSPSPVNILLTLLLITSAYFAASQAQLYMLLGVFWIPSVTYAYFNLVSDVVQRRWSFVALALVVALAAVFLFSQVIFIRYVSAYVVSPPQILSTTSPAIPTYDWLDALSWIKMNLPKNATVLTWWDYGYWISVIGNRTSLADNSTINSTQIALIGRLFTLDVTDYRSAVPEIVRLLDALGRPSHAVIFIPYVIATLHVDNATMCPIRPHACVVIWQPYDLYRRSLHEIGSSIIPHSIPSTVLASAESRWADGYCVAIPDNFFGLGVVGGDFVKSYWMARISGKDVAYIGTKLMTTSRLVLIPGVLERDVVTPVSSTSALIYWLMFNRDVLRRSAYVSYVCKQVLRVPDYKMSWIFDTLFVPELTERGIEIKLRSLPILLTTTRSPPLSSPPPGFELVHVSRPLGWVLVYRIDYRTLEEMMRG